MLPCTANTCHLHLTLPFNLPMYVGRRLAELQIWILLAKVSIIVVGTVPDYSDGCTCVCVCAPAMYCVCVCVCVRACTYNVLCVCCR